MFSAKKNHENFAVLLLIELNQINIYQNSVSIKVLSKVFPFPPTP